MYPHERSLVKRYPSERFAIVGINSDDDREAIRKVIAKEEISWRSFWDGGSADGPIAAAWNVRGWPTIYILDREGVIRYKSFVANEKEIDATLDRLLPGGARSEQPAQGDEKGGKSGQR